MEEAIVEAVHSGGTTTTKPIFQQVLLVNEFSQNIFGWMDLMVACDVPVSWCETELSQRSSS